MQNYDNFDAVAVAIRGCMTDRSKQDDIAFFSFFFG